MTKNLPNNGFFIKINIAFFLLKQGKLSSILHAIKVRFYSSNNSIGLVKYLNTDFEFLKNTVQNVEVQNVESEECLTCSA